MSWQRLKYGTLEKSQHMFNPRAGPPNSCSLTCRIAVGFPQNHLLPATTQTQTSRLINVELCNSAAPPPAPFPAGELPAMTNPTKAKVTARKSGCQPQGRQVSHKTFGLESTLAQALDRNWKIEVGGHHFTKMHLWQYTN